MATIANAALLERHGGGRGRIIHGATYCEDAGNTMAARHGIHSAQRTPVWPVNNCPMARRAVYRQTEQTDLVQTRMWANAQPDGRPAEHRWRPLFNAPKFG